MPAEQRQSDVPLSVVTGAFGFTGKYIARRLLSLGARVRTLVSHPGRTSPLKEQIDVALLNFDDPAGLVRSLQGGDTLYNTYWVRFARGQVSHQKAVANTQILIRAAEQAGIRRIVHLSVTNPSLDSPLPYFRGKAEVEEAIRACRLSYAILRPALVFGEEDILINNIAWLLRRLPVFVIPGSGNYRVQPIFAEDMARLAVDSGRSNENLVADAVGPESFTYNELVRLIATTVGSRAKIVHLDPGVVVLLARLLGWVVRDVLLTRDEIKGLMADLLVSPQPPNGETRLSSWLQANAPRLGKAYASELERHFRA